jgi:hypothetical protein
VLYSTVHVSKNFIFQKKLLRTELPILDDVPGRKQFLSGCNCRVKNFICSFRFGGEFLLLLLLYIEKTADLSELRA